MHFPHAALLLNVMHCKRSNATEFVIRGSVALSMSANTGLLLVFSFCLSFVFGDYNYGYETDFVYPQPDLYTNTSRQYYHSGTGRTR